LLRTVKCCDYILICELVVQLYCPSVLLYILSKTTKVVQRKCYTKRSSLVGSSQASHRHCRKTSVVSYSNFHHQIDNIIQKIFYGTSRPPQITNFEYDILKARNTKKDHQCNEFLKPKIFSKSQMPLAITLCTNNYYKKKSRRE